jgi:excisionase family DNA binding protein
MESLEAAVECIAALLAGSIVARLPAVQVQKRLMTTGEAAEYLGRSEDAVRHLIARGVIPVTKLDGKRQVDRTALDKLISERTRFEV